MKRQIEGPTRPKFKPQYRRLLFIDREILNGRYPNCSDLATKWEVSPKTIQRDIDYLRDELNAPVAYDALRRGFYYTEKNYRLPAVNISESDLFAVCLAQRVLDQFRNTPLHERLAAVFSRIQETLPDKVAVHPAWVDSRVFFFPEPATCINPAVWEVLAESMRDNRRVRIRHRSPGKPPTERDIDPYYLVNYRGEWYALAYCHKNRAVRTFAVSRMDSAERGEESFRVPAEFDRKDITREQFGIVWGTEEREVRVWFGSRVAPYIRERQWHAGQTLIERPNNAVELRFATRHLAEAKDWILSWGSQARVLAPRNLAERVRNELSDALKHYRQCRKETKRGVQ